MLNTFAKKISKSTVYALNGLWYAYQHDKSFRMETWGSIAFILFGYVLWPLTATEFLFLALSFFLILIAELINTAFERALERLHPERHELIGMSKDIASSAVLLAFVFAIVVALTILFNRFS